MQYTEIMIRYGELSTKGKNKKYFINKLRKNVQDTLYDCPEVRVSALRDRMHLELNGGDSEKVIKRLKNVSGIQTISPVIRVGKDLEDAKDAVLKLMAHHDESGLSFKVNTRRSDHSFEYDTNETNQILGSTVFEAFPHFKVQMKNPDITIRVEIRDRGIFISTETILGAGGLPAGTGGRAMLMLSGGIDSPVAGYLALKRGMDVEAVHFHSPPYTSPQALQKAKDLSARLAAYSGSIQFIEVPFTEIQEEIKRKVPEGYIMTVTRRMMMRITDKIRETRDALAIVNGESLGQVASQTLESMYVINEVTSTPVLRPLVMMDKNDIIELAREINTFDLSIQPYEDCCTIFAPPKPKTRPHLEKVEAIEDSMDVLGLVARAVENIHVESIHVGDESISKQEQEFFSFL